MYNLSLTSFGCRAGLNWIEDYTILKAISTTVVNVIHRTSRLRGNDYAVMAAVRQCMACTVGRLSCWLIPANMLLLAGCASLVPQPLDGHLADAGQVADCAAFMRDVDRQVAAASVTDAQTARISGFPYLRSNRFLAAFRDAPAADSRAWWTALRKLGQRGWQVELANLPADDGVWARLGVANRAAASRRLEACTDQLAAQDRQDPAARRLLRERSAVADAYADYQRILGLYPLTALAARQGIHALYTDIRATFDRRPDNLPVVGTLTDYQPPTVTGLPALPADYADVPRNALGVPQLSEQQIAALFRRHAPIWRIDVARAADYPGRPYWESPAKPSIDTADPVVYRKISYTRWQDQTLLQLNYVVWFPARPLTGPMDLLGGHLDGLTWRVTLAPDGKPLLYDSMHNCGCYHMAFPTAALQPRQPQGFWQEPLLVPATAPELQDDERIRLRIEQGTHYLQAVEAVAMAKQTTRPERRYRWDNYAALRSLPDNNAGRRSLFNPRGLVPGTERLERWLLWPMGVPDPGAMRQWGTHATAFVGKRHFDDPDLIERYFTTAP